MFINQKRIKELKSLRTRGPYLLKILGRLLTWPSEVIWWCELFWMQDLLFLSQNGVVLAWILASSPSPFFLFSLVFSPLASQDPKVPKVPPNLSLKSSFYTTNTHSWSFHQKPSLISPLHFPSSTSPNPTLSHFFKLQNRAGVRREPICGPHQSNKQDLAFNAK